MSREPHEEAKLLSNISKLSALSLQQGQEEVGAPTNFTIFHKLPRELRQQIWRETLPGPRTVEVKCNKGNACTSSAKIPTALHVSAEARAEAMRFYKLSFGIKADSKIVDAAPRIWFDNTIDIFYMDGRLGCSSFQGLGYVASALALRSIIRNVAGISDIKHLAISHDFLWLFCHKHWDYPVKFFGFDDMTSLINTYTIPRRSAMYRLSPLNKEKARVVALRVEEVERFYHAELKLLKILTGRDWKLAALRYE